MSVGGDFGGREKNRTEYSPAQVEAVLREIGIDVEAETTKDFLCYCPFHGNRHTPSFSVSRTSGSYICFNASCAEQSSSFVDLVKKVAGKDEFAARRLILLKKSETEASIGQRLNLALEKKEKFKEFPQQTIDRMRDDFWKHQPAIDYMHERGFEDKTLEKFEVGYSAKRNLVVVPMHDPGGLPVGVIGREPSKTSKRFKNSPDLPSSRTLFNFHRAKRTGDTVIIQEASMDVMRVDQAGYENTVACLMGNFSAIHFEMVDRTFSTVVIMTDFDKRQFHDKCRKCAKANLNICVGHNPGRDLGQTIAAGLRGKRILWASYQDRLVFPHNAKDAGDMTDEEIRQCLRGAVSNFEYQSWGLY